MKSMDRSNSGNRSDLRVSDSLVLFFLFSIGILCAALGKRFFPAYVDAAEPLLIFPRLLTAVFFALLLGSTVFGRFLIPPLSLLCGAASYLLSARMLASDEGQSSLVSLFLIVPAFFVIAALGMRTSSGLQRAFRLYSRPEIRETVVALLLRLAVFAVCVLGFSLLNR